MLNKTCTYITFKSAIKHGQLSQQTDPFPQQRQPLRIHISVSYTFTLLLTKKTTSMLMRNYTERQEV